MASSTSSRGSSRSKKRGKRKGIQRAAIVQTSLPPQVDGQIRCFLVIRISKVRWKLREPPAHPLLRVKWWGELTEGTIFSPAQRRLCARYAVRSGPKQFAEYLTDMGSLVMEVLDGSNMMTFAKVQVYGLNALTADRPIVGSYPIFSMKAEIIGHLTVNISIQSLNVFEDSSSAAAPTTDLDTSDARSLRLQGIHMDAKENSEPSLASRGSTLWRAAASRNDHADAGSSRFAAPYNKRKTEHCQNPSPSAVAPTYDLLSLLLERGEKLKAAMANCTTIDHGIGNGRTNGIAARERQPELPLRTADRASPVESSMSTVVPARDYGYHHKQQTGSVVHPPEHSVLDKEYDKAVGLLFDDDILAKANLLPYMKFCPSDDDRSLSEEVDLDQSDENDPLHNEELIEELFYSTKKSSSSSSSISMDAELSLMSSSVAGHAHRVHSLRNSHQAAVGDGRDLRDMGFSAAAKSAVGDRALMDAAGPLAETKSSEQQRNPRPTRSSQSSSASASDNDVDCSDNASRVSFDMAQSEDDEEPRGLSSAVTRALDAQQLTLLGQVKVARVTVHSLALNQANQPGNYRATATGKPLRQQKVTAAAARRRGKPPAAPLISKSLRAQIGSTYFIEYRFPVVAASRDNSESNAMATETVRAVSKKWESMADGTEDFIFGNYAVFPAFFDGEAVQKWWSSMLVFKVFCRPPGEKMVSQAGVASLPMRDILQSTSFCFAGELDVHFDDGSSEASRSGCARAGGARTGRRRARQSAAGSQVLLGKLKVKIELTSDAPSFQCAMKEYTAKRAHAAAVEKLMRPVPVLQEAAKGEGIAIPAPLVVKTDVLPKQDIVQVTGTLKLPKDDGLTIHVLLSVSNGKGFDPAAATTENAKLTAGPNLYVVCRGFWDESDSLVSQVSWNSATPKFSLLETIPMFLGEDVLMRMKNNFMIIEVWSKKRITVPSDELVGLVKIPLNILYSSFRDRRIAQLLLRSEYPVVCVDNYMPVTCPYTGELKGDLHVLLAAGSRDQIADVQAARSCQDNDPMTKADVASLRDGKRERLPVSATQGHSASSAKTEANTAEIEHIYEIAVKEIRSFAPNEDMLWGEADCFVQYHFPCQEQGNTAVMKGFRTDTVLCVPNPIIGHKQVHSLVLPAQEHVQATLLKATGGMAAGSCVPFEVWCRFYHPNIRDQLLAKGRLPVAKLCALATMLHLDDEGGTHASFSVPLSHADGSGKVGSAGLLDVAVSYRRTPSCSALRPLDAVTGRMSDFLMQHDMAKVAVRLFVHRACGLQSATRALSRKHKAMDFFSQVGPNVFLKITLANAGLPAQDFRVSPTVARTFCPDFLYYTDFTCPVMTADGVCLAEVLESTQAIIEVWHQAEREDVFSGHEAEVDTLLGVAVVPLKRLITHKTGMAGWFPIAAPRGMVAISDDPIFGGLEIEAKFANNFDRQIVIDAASKAGWPIPEDAIDNIVAAGTPAPKQTIISVDVSNIRVSSDLFDVRPETELSRAALSASSSRTPSCYIKFTLYDAETFYSSPQLLQKDGQIMCSKRNISEQFTMLITPPFLWYLHESHLEIQLWSTHCSKALLEPKADQTTADHFMPPYVTDRYLGSAFIELSALSASGKAVVSDVYPLYNKGCPRAGQASMEVHVSRTNCDSEHLGKQTTERCLPPRTEANSKTLEEEGQNESDQEASIVETDGSMARCTRLHVTIDQALHLKLWTSNGGVFVTFVWKNRERKTKSATPTDSNVHWLHESSVSIPEDQLFEAKDVVFKVWQETATGPRVIGFVSVDLMPLLHGLPELAGWYNIMDFSSLCQGQIKIGIRPQTPLGTSALARTSTTSNQGADTVSFRDRLPLFYHTSAAYSAFPAHIAHFCEQQVVAKSSDVGAESSLAHHDEHVIGVRRHHSAARAAASEQQLHEPSCGAPRGQPGSSHDSLQSKLRKTLQELDNLTSSMKKRLRGDASGLAAAALRSTMRSLPKDGNGRPTEDRAAQSLSGSVLAGGGTASGSESDEEDKPLLHEAAWERSCEHENSYQESDDEDHHEATDQEGSGSGASYVRVINEELPHDAIARSSGMQQPSRGHYEQRGRTASVSAVASGNGGQLTEQLLLHAVSASIDEMQCQPSANTGSDDRTEQCAEDSYDPGCKENDGEKPDVQGVGGREEHLEAPASEHSYDPRAEVWSPDIDLAAYINNKHYQKDAGRPAADTQCDNRVTKDTTNAPSCGVRDHSSLHASIVWNDDEDILDDQGTSIWNGSQTNLAELSVAEGTSRENTEAGSDKAETVGSFTADEVIMDQKPQCNNAPESNTELPPLTVIQPPLAPGTQESADSDPASLIPHHLPTFMTARPNPRPFLALAQRENWKGTDTCSPQQQQQQLLLPKDFPNSDSESHHRAVRDIPEQQQSEVKPAAPESAASAVEHELLSRVLPATEDSVHFFPSAAQLESSMRALRLANAVSVAMQKDDNASAHESLSATRFPRRPLPLALSATSTPTSETARRLAHIFSTRFSRDSS